MEPNYRNVPSIAVVSRVTKFIALLIYQIYLGC